MRTTVKVSASSVLAVLTLTPLVAYKRIEPRYTLVKVGTFGGPNSVYNVFSRMATNSGIIVGAANTADPDPYPSACFDFTCFVQHAWEWRRGGLHDLGVLRKGLSSYTNAVNSRGLIVGHAQNGDFDPFTGAPAFVATVWNHGQITNLGTLGGANSTAIAATDQNFVMGAAENGIVDTSGMPGFDQVSQIRAFGWNGGQIFDLGTLGGDDTFPGDMNSSGQVVGQSTTTTVPDANGIIPRHPFLWTRGRMRDLGTLGGHFAGAGAINTRGQVVGTSSLAGDQTYHPFVWHNGTMIDLGTLGGSYAEGEWINDSGDAIGFSTRAGVDGLYAFIWKHGVMSDLGTVPGDNSSNAFGINNLGQVVGQSWFFDGQQVTKSHAFLWNGHGPMIDLNTLVSNASDLYLTEANFITDRGWIVAIGVLPNSAFNTAILIPEDQIGDLAASATQRQSLDVAVPSEIPVPPTPEVLQKLSNRSRSWIDVLQRHR